MGINIVNWQEEKARGFSLAFSISALRALLFFTRSAAAKLIPKGFPGF